jgi:iron complex outermembrane receptor protein
MMKYLPRASILPMLLLISAMPSQGAESLADLSEQDFLADVPVVLTASRLRQNVADAPAAVTVIDRQMIRDSGAWSIPDLFRLVPGMYVGESADRGALVPNTIVSYHGLSDSFSRRMQVLVDGRSIYTPLFGGAVWSTLPLALEDIERIEVIRGPNSATYGANSFLGIINIISRQAADVPGSMLSLTQSNRGSDSTFRYGGQIGSLDYRVTGSLRSDQGIELQAPTAPGHSFSVLRHDDKRLTNLNFRGDLQLGNRDSLEIQAGLSSGDHQSGRRESPGAYEASPPHTRELNSYYGLLRWQHTLSADEQLSLKAYASRDEQNVDLSALLKDPQVTISGFPFYLEVPSPLNSTQRLVAERYDVELQHAFAPTYSTRLVWGGGARLDRFSSAYYLNSTEPVEFRQQNLFANLEWRPAAKWVLNMGGMLERNSFSGTYLSPRLAANYHWLPGHTLRLIASRATHTPTIFEAKSDIRLNTNWRSDSCSTLKLLGLVTSCTFPTVRSAYHQDNLRSETIDSRELGYLWELPGGHLDFKYSYDRLGDLLETYRPAGKDWQEYRNEGNAQVRAAEMQWQQKLTSNTRIHLALATSRISGFNSERPAAYAESAASHSRSMLLAHDFDHRWTGSLAYYAVGQLTVQGDGDLQKPYERVDARLAYRFRDGAYQGEISFIVQNLFNNPYKEVYFENLIGRRSYVNLRLEF